MSKPTLAKPTDPGKPTDARIFQQKLDRCGHLLAVKAAADSEPWRAELVQLLSDIRAHYDDQPADLPIRAEGAQYYIDLSKRENQRTISDKRAAFDSLKKTMGIAPLMEALTYPFKLLDKHVTPEKQAAYVTQARTGSRDVTAVLKSIPNAA